MLNKYIYKEENITIDIIIKIEQVARLISKYTDQTFDESLCDFYDSRTYKALEKTHSLMWFENAEFIVEEYFREKNYKI